MAKIVKSDAEWQKELSPEAYAVLRRFGTEPAFSGALLSNAKTGDYLCGACGNRLFSSNTKFDSGSGWPSFWAPMTKNRVALRPDTSLALARMEVRCARCGSHLGHLFADAPRTPSGQRYCVNSAALRFEKKQSLTLPCAKVYTILP